MAIKALGRALQLIMADDIKSDCDPSNKDLRALVDNLDLNASVDDSNVLSNYTEIYAIIKTFIRRLTFPVFRRN